MMNLQWFDFVGFAGVLLVLAAYGACRRRRMAMACVRAAQRARRHRDPIPVLYADELNYSVLFIETAWIRISLTACGIRSRARP